MVVVIDDDKVQGMVIAETINKAGVEAQHITSWCELTHILQKRAISCLVIDYFLEDGWQGPEVAKLLRSFGCKETPIYFTSSDNSEVVRRQCESAGHPFIPKKWRWLLSNIVVASVLRKHNFQARLSGEV